MYNIKKHILEYESVDYAKEEEIVNENLLDCSFGVNPFGCSNKVTELVKSIPIEEISHYPESSKAMKNSIIKFWEDIVDLKTENIFQGNGSMGVLYSINSLLVDRGDKMLGYGPQFSAYVGGIIRNGVIYDYVQLTEENNYKFDYKEVIDAIEEEHKFIYIDNPNNPTGQIIPIAEIEEIVKAADEMNKIVIIDEAYGDFMPRKNSAVNLIGKNKNVVVTRTMSKGLGLAGIRAGYLIADKFFVEQYAKVGEIFDCNGPARYLSCIALEDKQFIEECIEKVRCNKEKLLNSLTGLHYAYTSPETPIVMLIHPDKNVDLSKELIKKYIKTVPLASFTGASKNSVRLRIPADIDELIDRLSK